MATPTTLCATALVQYELPEDDPRMPQRSLYFTRQCWDWVEGELDYQAQTDWPKRPDEPVLPSEQVELVCMRFVLGDAMTALDVKWLEPQRDGIWELRTSDVRIFGWFHKPRCFIAARGVMATKLKRQMKDGYNQFIRLVQQDLEALDLDAPKFITGDRNAVL